MDALIALVLDVPAGVGVLALFAAVCGAWR